MELVNMKTRFEVAADVRNTREVGGYRGKVLLSWDPPRPELHNRAGQG